MKVIIEKKSEIASIHFKDKNKIIKWEDLTKQQQIEILNTFVEFHSLFKGFIKL
jgi:hypothetical protein